MAIPKVILYYGFTPIADPAAVRLWQYDLCELLSLTGRIIISEHGINGTLGGSLNYPGFNKIDFKWSEGTGNDFPKLMVRVRDEVVSLISPRLVRTP